MTWDEAESSISQRRAVRVRGNSASVLCGVAVRDCKNDGWTSQLP